MAKDRHDPKDPRWMDGHDVRSMLAIKDIAPIDQMFGFTLVGLAAGLMTSNLIYTAPNWPVIITFMTGFIDAPGPLPAGTIFLSNRLTTAEAGALNAINSIPLDLGTRDQFTTIARPGETWYAGTTLDNIVLTTLVRSLLVDDRR